MSDTSQNCQQCAVYTKNQEQIVTMIRQWQKDENAGVTHVSVLYAITKLLGYKECEPCHGDGHTPCPCIDEGCAPDECETCDGYGEVLDAPKQDGDPKCEDCTTYFASYKCNKPLECDCPKCQGLCLCNNCVTCEGDRKVNSRRQLCGCIICYCEGDQCQGCGAGMCPAHANYYATSGLMFDGYGKEPCPTCTVTT